MRNTVVDVVIVGAGPVGTNAAVFLAAMGISVQLLEVGSDILEGASRAAFINHGDGFEYYKPGHRRTGELCIDGAFAKGLLYPIAALQTKVCDADHPIRFLLTAESARKDGITLTEFFENARSMQRHFARRFVALRRKLDFSVERMALAFSRTPDTFWRPLGDAELADVNGIVGGCSGSSSGINMAYYYAFLKDGIRTRGVGFQSNCVVESIEASPGGYVVNAGGNAFRARQVMLAAGHQVPALVSKIRGIAVGSPPAGTYFLNAMTLLELPPTRNRHTLEAARRINFALQQEQGGMFACLAAPSESRAGMAAVYAPSSSGSQLSAHSFRAGSPPPVAWNSSIADGLPVDDVNVLGTWQRICRLYPFLEGYGKIRRTMCRAVFNLGTTDSNGGTDRRVREIVDVEPRISADASISAWAAPKWTNAELVALMATDHVLKGLGARQLPKHAEFGLGPTALDVAEIADSLRLSSCREDDALRYIRAEGLPESLLGVAPNTGSET